MSCPHTDPSCWCSPPPLWPADSARWAAFCLEINARIQRTRRTEGRDDIGTFSTPLPARVEVRPLPAGRVMPIPANTDNRDEHGRFRRSQPQACSIHEEGTCGAGDCAIDWLFDPNGPDDPAWRARIRAEDAAGEPHRKASV